MLEHFTAAARACAPLPFFVYEFAARSGYAVPVRVIQQLRERADNLTGLKVSDTPWERFEPYLLDGMSIFAGPEALIAQAMARGAVGSVSALASAFPELVVEAVRSGTPEASARCGRNQCVPIRAARRHRPRCSGCPTAYPLFELLFDWLSTLPPPDSGDNRRPAPRQCACGGQVVI